MATSEDLFLQLTILIVVAVAGHFLIRRFRQPTIIGEIAIGVVLGPSVLVPFLKSWGILAPTSEGLFDPQLIAIFASLGAIFLLFQIGLEMDVKAIYRRRNVLVAIGGILIPWLMGFIVAWAMLPDAGLLETRFITATFVGAMLVSTSTAIAAAILLELKMVRTDIATTIMGAVVVDDLLSLLVLSMALGVAAGNVDLFGLALLVAISVGFIGSVIYLGTRVFSRFIVWLHKKALRSGLKNAGFMIAVAVAFSLAFVSEAIGLSAVIGAFLAGAIVSGTVLRHDFQEGIQFLAAIFTPVFFISLGLLVDLRSLNPNLLLFGGALLVVAIVSKFVGCGLMARGSGIPGRGSVAIGLAMIPRGEVGLIVAVVAQQQGIIGPDLFAIVVLIILLVSLLPAPLLRRSLQKLRPTGIVESALPGAMAAVEAK